jgi:hypothetical protein
MSMQNNGSTWGGFSEKTATTVGPQPGKTLAYMLPTQTEHTGDFGPYLKVEYNTFVFDPATQDYRIYVQSEICSLNDPVSSNDKIVRRLAAVNAMSPVDAVGQLATLIKQGFLILNLKRDEGGFLRVADSEPLPASYSVPLQIQTLDYTVKPQREHSFAAATNSEPPF